MSRDNRRLRAAATFVITLLAAAVMGCREEKPVVAANAPAPVKAGAVERLDVPSGEGAAEPFLFSTSSGLLLSWLEPVANTDRVALRIARHDGAKWSAPRTVVERNDLFVNWADFPSVVEDAKGALFAHWLQKSGPNTYAYDVVMATSRDGGATWSKPFLLNRDGKQTEHGFVSLAPLAGGGVGATWLDGRNMQVGGGHEHDAGDMTLRYATVDADGAISSDVELDDRTCECCTTGMTIAAQGPLIVYRDRFADETRDISYVRLNGREWSKPQPLRQDGWRINACPVNGPQIDSIGNAVATAWFTAANEQQRVYAAFSNDGGAKFGETITVDDGKPAGRVDLVMISADSAVVAWLEQTGAGAEIRARRIGRDGIRTPSLKVADSSTARATGFTRIAKVSDAIYFAWTEQDAKSKRIRLARAPVN